MNRNKLAVSIALAMAGTLSGAAHARQQPAAHDIQWYVEHPQQRESVLRLCQSDETYALRYDCLNAQRAATKSLALGAPITTNTSSVSYWLHQDSFLVATCLNSCRRLNTTPSLKLFVSPSDCPAISAAAAQMGIK